MNNYTTLQELNIDWIYIYCETTNYWEPHGADGGRFSLGFFFVDTKKNPGHQIADSHYCDSRPAIRSNLTRKISDFSPSRKNPLSGIFLRMG